MTKSRTTPPAIELLLARRSGESFASIAKTYGCTCRAVYYAIDRYACAGLIPPILVPVIFEGDTYAQIRLLELIKSTQAQGVDVIGWGDLVTTRSRYQI